MHGQKRDVDAIFGQPTTIAPTEQLNAELHADTGQPVNAPPSPLPEKPATMAPKTVSIYTQEQAKIGETQQPNRLYEILLVMLQFGLLAIIIVAFMPAPLWQQTALQIIGSCMMVMGVALGVWAVVSFRQRVRILPSPSATGLLVTDGPFAHIRHPMYSALLLVSTGLFLAYPTIIRLVAIILLAVVLFVKMRYEERLLAARYSGYGIYQTHTGRLFPKLSHKNRKPSASTHSEDA